MVVIYENPPGDDVHTLMLSLLSFKHTSITLATIYAKLLQLSVQQQEMQQTQVKLYLHSLQRMLMRDL